MSYFIGVIGDIFGDLCKDELFFDINLDYLRGFLYKAYEQALSIKNENEDIDGDDSVYIVTGLIDKGINKLAFELAKEENLKLVGIDSEEAKTYKTLDIDDNFFIKGDFGIENEFFVQNIDILINICGRNNRDLEKERLATLKNIPVIRKS